MFQQRWSGQFSLNLPSLWLFTGNKTNAHFQCVGSNALRRQEGGRLSERVADNLTQVVAVFFFLSFFWGGEEMPVMWDH